MAGRFLCAVGQAIGIWSSAAALDELGQLSAPLYALASTKLGELADPLRELVLRERVGVGRVGKAGSDSFGCVGTAQNSR